MKIKSDHGTSYCNAAELVCIFLFSSQGQPGLPGRLRHKQIQSESGPDLPTEQRHKSRTSSRHRLKNSQDSPNLLKTDGQKVAQALLSYRCCVEWSFCLSVSLSVTVVSFVRRLLTPLQQSRLMSRSADEQAEESSSFPLGTKDDPGTTCYELKLIHPHLEDGEHR